MYLFQVNNCHWNFKEHNNFLCFRRDDEDEAEAEAEEEYEEEEEDDWWGMSMNEMSKLIQKNIVFWSSHF